MPTKLSEMPKKRNFFPIFQPVLVFNSPQNQNSRQNAPNWNTVIKNKETRSSSYQKRGTHCQGQTEAQSTRVSS